MLVKFRMKKKDWTGIFLTARVQRLYKEYEDNIVSGLETASGLSFRRGFTVVVSNLTSNSLWFGSAGFDGKKAISIEIPASRVISDDIILWLLIHEIGHRLLDQHNIQTPTVKARDIFNEQEHRLLFSFLIEAIKISFGSQHAKSIIESGPKRGYKDMKFGHTRAWKWAVSMTPKQRKAAWKKLKASYSHSLHRPANI